MSGHSVSFFLSQRWGLFRHCVVSCLSVLSLLLLFCFPVHLGRGFGLSSHGSWPTCDNGHYGSGHGPLNRYCTEPGFWFWFPVFVSSFWYSICWCFSVLFCSVLFLVSCFLLLIPDVVDLCGSLFSQSSHAVIHCPFSVIQTSPGLPLPSCSVPR